MYVLYVHTGKPRKWIAQLVSPCSSYIDVLNQLEKGNTKDETQLNSRKGAINLSLLPSSPSPYICSSIDFLGCEKALLLAERNRPLDKY